MMFQAHDRTIRGLEYRLRTTGHAGDRLMLLLHGLFDTGASFAPLVEGLDRQGAVPRHYVAPDWRGHGDSAPAPEGYWFPDYLADLETLMEALSPDRPVVLAGHSMGGNVASMYAGARPEAVSHLIILDSLNVPDAPAADAPQRYRDWLDGLNRNRGERTFATLDEVAARIAGRYPELSPEQLLFLAESWARPAADGGFRLAFDPRHRLPFPYGFRADEAMALWRQVRAPALCLDAEHSPARRWMTDDAMARRRACFSSMTREIVPGCGHMLHVQAPDEVASRIERFVADDPAMT